MIQKRKDKEIQAIASKVEWGYVDHVKENKDEVTLNVRLKSIQRSVYGHQNDRLIKQAKKRRRSQEEVTRKNGILNLYKWDLVRAKRVELQ